MWYLIVSIPDLCTLTYFAYQNSLSIYGIIRRAAKKPVVVIYKVMYTEHYESTLIEAIECINNESLD